MTVAFRAGTIAAALWLTASMACAEVKTLASAQGWQSFGGTTQDATPVCGISKELETKYFSVKLFAGRDTMTIQLSNKDWELVKGEEYEITMRFDQSPLWRATGVGFQFDDGDMGVEYTVRRQELNEFNREFAASSGLVLHIAEAGKQDWTIDLSGMDDVRRAFVTCTNDLK
jgi:hypothetical protein